MERELLLKYDQRVPRYTSYPTALQFSAEVGAGDYARWLGGLTGDSELSLYFHVPFCRAMCWFCGCYTKIVAGYEPVAAYLETLKREVELVAARLPARGTVRHMHMGGGSPTMLKGSDFADLADHVGRHFDLSDGAEFAVEVDPRTATRDYVQAMAAAGVNRASMGVQDFNDTVQAATNRIQPFETTLQVVDWFREAGIEHINMDLMYGLPLQTTELLLRTVDLAVQLQPRRIALFGYAHVPWMKSHQKMIHDEDLPDILARAEQFKAASERLAAQGYVPIGLDHFARADDELALARKQGRLHRNFQGYTTDEAEILLGFGASAIGSLPDAYVQNLSPLKEYAETVAAGELPIARGVAVSGEDRLRRAIIERLMCDHEVDLEAVCGRYGANASDFAPELAALTPLEADGLVQVDGARLTVPEAARPLVRAVCAIFDQYLAPGEERHSKAV